MYRAFKKETGLSPIEYRNRLRIERARTLLSRDICSVSEAAKLLGFESVYYFSRVFKQHTGVAPSQYGKDEQQKLP